MHYLIGGIIFFVILKASEKLLKQKLPTFYLALTPLGALSFGLIKIEVNFLFLLTILLWCITIMDMMNFSIYSIYLYLYAAFSVYAFFYFKLNLDSRLIAFGVYTLSLVIYHFFRKEAIGEGDILFIAFSSLALGLYGTSILLLIATISALFCLFLRKYFFKISLYAPLPFFPFLSLGTYIVYFTFIKGWLTLL